MKMSILIYKINATLIKILRSYFTELDWIFLKFIWKTNMQKITRKIANWLLVRVPRKLNGKENFSANSISTPCWISTSERMQLVHYVTAYTKTNSNSIISLNARANRLLRQSECRLKKEFPDAENFRRGVNLLRARSRDNEGTVSEVGWPPDRPGESTVFCGLVANFYNLKTNSCWKVGPRGLVSL